jgi:UDP-N-acetylglucosamine 2-epimerase (non-hydrolysing)
LREVTRRFADTHVVFPVHPNPNVREVVYHELRDTPSITLIEPVSYADFMRLVHRSYILLTDSGGLQEEAPAMRKPVLVLRETTERPELLDVGAGLLVGTDTTRIVRAASRLLQNRRTYERMASAPNPFGDGKAAVRIVDLLEQRLSGAAMPYTSETFALAAS